MNRSMVIAVLLLVPYATHAQYRQSPEAHISHFVRTHKELIVSDAIVIAAESADASSSVHCLHVSQGCTEENPLLGRRPSAGALWGSALSVSAGIVTMDHLIWHLNVNTDPDMRHLVWLSSIPLGVFETINVKSNVDVAEGLQNARNRVTQ